MAESPNGKLVEALRKAVSRTSMLAEGHDPELDSVVRQVRQKITTGDDAKEIQKALTSVEPLILKIDESRIHRAKQVRDTLHDLLDMLEQLDNPVPQKGKRQLEGAIRTHWNTPSKWPELFQLYLELAQSTLDNNVDQQESSFSFKRLFRRPEKPTEQKTPQEISAQIAHSFTALLSNLSLPSHYDDDISQLKRALSSNQDFNQLPQILDDAINLISLAITGSQTGLTNYLTQLNKQLASINNSIVTSYKKQRNLSSSREYFDQQLKTQMAGTKKEVQEATDLDVLKGLIDERMTTITQTMSQYRTEMIEQEKQANQSISLLKNKVNHMEKDAEALRSLLQQRLAQAMTDSLTNLPNRAAYQEAITTLFDLMNKQGQPLCLAVCDIDHFKKINDSWGHLAGDKVLRLVPRQVRNILAKDDLMFRYGGEEFVIVLPNTSLEQAVARAEQVRLEVEKTPFNMEGEPVSVSISIGVAQAQPNEEPNNLFARADKQLYQAKNSGRNRVSADK